MNALADSERDLMISVCRLVDHSDVSAREALAALLTVAGQVAANAQFPAAEAQRLLGNAIARGLVIAAREST